MRMKVLAILAAIVLVLSIHAALKPAIDQQILETQPSVKKAVAVIRIVLLNRLCS